LNRRSATGRQTTEVENIEHRTFNVELRSSEGKRCRKFGMKFGKIDEAPDKAPDEVWEPLNL